MDGISEGMHKIMSTNRGVEVMKSGVTKSGVMDGSEIGSIVHKDDLKLSPEKVNDTSLETDSQFLLTALEVILGMIEIGNLTDSQKAIYGKTIEIVSMLKQKDSFKKPTEQIKNVLRKAKKETTNLGQSLTDEQTKKMFSDMVHYDENEIENLVDEINKDEQKENETNE